MMSEMITIELSISHVLARINKDMYFFFLRVALFYKNEPR